MRMSRLRRKLAPTVGGDHSRRNPRSPHLLEDILDVTLPRPGADALRSDTHWRQYFLIDAVLVHIQKVRRIPQRKIRANVIEARQSGMNEGIPWMDEATPEGSACCVPWPVALSGVC